MSEALVQNTPPTPPAEAPVQPPAPPAPAPSAGDVTPTPTPPSDAPAPPAQPAAPTDGRGTGTDKVVTTEKDTYEAELKKYLAGELTEEPPAPPPAAPPETAPEPPAPPSEPPPQAPVVDDTDDLPKDGTLPKDLRVKPKSAWQLEELSLRKRGYSPVAAAKAASELYPDAQEAKEFASLTQPKAPEAPPADAPPPGTPAPSSVADIDVRLAELEDAADAAVMDFKPDDAKHLRAEIRQLQAKRALALVSELQQAAAQEKQQQTEIEKQFYAVLDQAEALYPALKDKDSPFAQRAATLQKQMVAANDPLASTPESALIIAARVARELGVAPVAAAPAAPPATPPAPPSPPPTTSSVPVHRKPPGAAIIASGPARTAPAQPPPEVNWEKMGREEYEALKAKTLAGVP